MGISTGENTATGRRSEHAGRNDILLMPKPAQNQSWASNILVQCSRRKWGCSDCDQIRMRRVAPGARDRDPTLTSVGDTPASTDGSTEESCDVRISRWVVLPIIAKISVSSHIEQFRKLHEIYKKKFNGRKYGSHGVEWIFFYSAVILKRNIHFNSVFALKKHYDDVTMSPMASQITGLTIVYLTVYSGADQRKHQSSASLAFVRGIHRWPLNSPHKGPVTRKMFPFVGVIMIS